MACAVIRLGQRKRKQVRGYPCRTDTQTGARGREIEKGDDMARRGRKRKTGVTREPNGRVSRKEQPGSVISPELLQRRAELAGCSLEDAAARPEAGYALGQVMLRGIIGRRQHDAGMAFRGAWLRWASLAGLPPHEVMQRGGGIIPTEVDAEQWAKARDAFEACVRALFDCHHPSAVWSAVESVVMDDVLPPLLHERAVGVLSLCRGLDALADHYKMPRRDAA